MQFQTKVIRKVAGMYYAMLKEQGMEAGSHTRRMAIRMALDAYNFVALSSNIVRDEVQAKKQ